MAGRKHQYDIARIKSELKLTEKQKIYLDAIEEYGTILEASRKLGKGRSTIRNSMDALQQKLNKNDKMKWIDEGMSIKGTSALIKTDPETGEQYKSLEWIKTDRTKEAQYEGMKKAIEALMKNVAKPSKRPSIPEYTNNDCMTVYTMGDAHIGMLAWDKETGADHDLEIAERDLLGAMTMLTNQANPTKEAFIVDVGDYFHTDNMNNTTAKSGNVLDVDSRYPKVLQIGLRITTELIDLALQKHEIVRWRSAIGNHNEVGSMMMSAFISAYYRDESRVIVHDTPNMFMYHQFGKNLIGITHGHTCKAEKLGEIMSVDCEEIWSSTKHRFWYTGHIHHLSTKEFPSCVVETFRTLAGKDAWHSASGYRSGQDMKAITLHKDYGEVSRNTVNIMAIRSR